MDKENIILYIIMIGLLMSAIDSSIVILALPTITKYFSTNFLTSIWTLLIYIFIVLLFTTQFGRLSDKIGRSYIYNFGFVIFTIGSFLCGYSQDIYQLITFRAIQAIGASMLQSTSSAIIADIFPENKRGRAFGYTSLGWNVGSLLGIILGGIIITYIAWQYIFYINVPIGIIASILAFKYIDDKRKVKSKFDIIGVILLFITLLLFSLGLIFISSFGFNIIYLFMIILSIFSFIIFIRHETKVEYPIINIKAFKNKILSYSLLSSFFQGMGFMSVNFILILYLQGVRLLSPLQASLILIPGYITAGILAPIFGKISDKGYYKKLTSIGLILLIIAVISYDRLLTQNSDLLYISLITILSGIGTSLFFPSNNKTIMDNADKEIYGSISGLLRTLTNIGLLLSFIFSISISTLFIPRNVAFEVLLGTYNNSLPLQFIDGLHYSLYFNIIILFIALVFSILKDKYIKTNINIQN